MILPTSRNALIILFIFSLQACLIFEDESIPEHCNNGLMDAGETGIDCGVICFDNCPPPTCDDEILNGTELGIDCGPDCDILCYTPPSCDTENNKIVTNFGTYVFNYNGSVSNLILQEWQAYSESISGNGILRIYLDRIGYVNQNQNVVDQDNTSYSYGQIDISVRFSETNTNIDGKFFTVVDEVPVEFNPDDCTFTLYFCDNPVVATGTSTWEGYNYLTGSVTFKMPC